MLLATIMMLALAPGDDRCADALAAAAQYTACAQGRVGVALSTTQDGADRLLGYAESAEPRFRRHFPGDIPPYLVLYFEDDPPVEALLQAGFSTVLAWPSPEKLSQLVATSLRQNALAQAPGGGPLSEEAELALRLQTTATLASLEAKQEEVVAHELGHTWYSPVFWRGSDVALDGYATPGPDWLDETAAILTQDDVLSENERQLFAARWAALTPADRVAPMAIGDLQHFLQRPHPSQTRQATPSGSATAGPATVTIRGGAREKAAFYNQVRVFADYLIFRSGDDAVFAEVSRVIVGGMGFEGWLGSQTQYPALPRTVAELQADWVSWIDSGAVRRRT